MGGGLLVSGGVQTPSDKLRSSYSVMTYHKEGPACGKIPCDPTSSEADCEYLLDLNNCFFILAIVLLTVSLKW